MSRRSRPWRRPSRSTPPIRTSHLFLGSTYAAQRRYAEAIAAYQRAIALGLDTPATQIALGAAYAGAGDRAQARTVLARLQSGTSYVSPGEIAILLVALGERDAAFASLEKAYETHDLQLQLTWARTRGSIRCARIRASRTSCGGSASHADAIADFPSQLPARRTRAPPTCSRTRRSATCPRSISRSLASRRPNKSRRHRGEPGPPRLVTGAKPRAVVTVEVLVEEDQIPPVRIVLELGGSSVHRPPSVGAPQERGWSAGARSPARPRTRS